MVPPWKPPNCWNCPLSSTCCQTTLPLRRSSGVISVNDYYADSLNTSVQIKRLSSHLSPLTSHFSPLTSHLLTSHFSLLTSHFSPLTSHAFRQKTSSVVAVPGDWTRPACEADHAPAGESPAHLRRRTPRSPHPIGLDLGHHWRGARYHYLHSRTDFPGFGTAPGGQRRDLPAAQRGSTRRDPVRLAQRAVDRG